CIEHPCYHAHDDSSGGCVNRRDFLKTTGVAAGVHAVRGLAGVTQDTSIIVDPDDPIASASPAIWAVRELQSALGAQGMRAQIFPRVTPTAAGSRYVIVAGGDSPIARQILSSTRVTIPSSADALCLVPHSSSGKSGVLATATGVRGLVYTILELADR